MELRTLRYFLAVANERSLTSAAKVLHVTQPTLSRQLAALEQEIGHELYTRNSNGVELTEFGVLLRDRAESMVAMADRIDQEMLLSANSVAGTVHIGTGDTKAISLLAEVIKTVRSEYPGITFQIYSGATSDLMVNLERGVYDVVLECEMQPHTRLNVLALPQSDDWCVVMRRDDPLAALDRITPKDLAGRSVILPRQYAVSSPLRLWADGNIDKSDVAVVFSLPLNLRYLVTDGVGVALTYDGLIVNDEDPVLCSRLMYPKLTSHHNLLWRKTLPTKQTEVFLEAMKTVCKTEESNIDTE